MKTHHNHSVFAKMRWKGIYQNARTCEHLTLAGYKDSEKIALPETNIFAPENRPSQKGIHLPTNHWFEGVNYQFQGGSLGSIFVKLAIPMLDMSVGYVHLSILAIRASATKSSAPLNPIPSYHGRPQNVIIACVFREGCLKSRFQLYIILPGWSMKTQ